MFSLLTGVSVICYISGLRQRNKSLPQDLDMKSTERDRERQRGRDVQEGGKLKRRGVRTKGQMTKRENVVIKRAGRRNDK